MAMLTLPLTFRVSCSTPRSNASFRDALRDAKRLVHQRSAREQSPPRQSPQSEVARGMDDGALPPSQQSWRERHAAAAAAFVELMLRIRAEGAERFQEGIWGLWQAAEALDPVDFSADIDPTTSSMHLGTQHVLGVTPTRVRPRQLSQKASPYGAVGQRWLLSFEAMARQIRDEHAEILEEGGQQAEALKFLVATLGVPLNGHGTRSVCSRTVSGRDRAIKVTPLGLAEATVAPIYGDIVGSWAVLPLIWLPLALYVRSTTHLYEMLDRLQRMVPLIREREERCLDAAEELRSILDRDIRRYSYLVFTITAAIQALLLARRELGKRFPWDLLASSPPDPAKGQPNGYPMRKVHETVASHCIYRGMWVPSKVDEERAIYQYSFQSFSREVAGMAQVLSFYASVAGTPTARLAAEHRHLLIIVVQLTKDTLALPVQLLDGPREDKSELEVLLPPYVRYEFEEDLSLCSADFGPRGPLKEAQLKLEELRSKWNGYELPEMLLNLLQRRPLSEEFAELRYLRPSVTLRFVHRIEPGSENLRALFTDPAFRLYDFGRDNPGMLGMNI